MEKASAIADDVKSISRIAAVPTILQVVAHMTGMRFTAIARVTDKKWTACAVYDRIDFGLKPGDELVLESTICNEIRQHHQPVVFGHASEHPLFATHPTPKLYGFESYISIPIFRSDGLFFGTLCAIDPLPAKLDDPNVVKTLELFAQLIAAHLDAEDRLQRSDSALLDAQETAKLREQFIAVLGHDLRNPLQAIGFGTALLEQMVSETRAQRAIDSIKRSCGRMTELIENILDFARGRLGGGIQLRLETNDKLAEELQHVVSEVQAAHAGRIIESTIAIKGPVACDSRRIGQLLSNLLANAFTHGAADQPVRVVVKSDDDAFELSVANAGTRIPSDKLARLFQPFERGDATAHQRGLGLGLYIAAEIARAHGGVLDVSSSADAGTRFDFRMPKPSGEV